MNPRYFPDAHPTLGACQSRHNLEFTVGGFLGVSAFLVLLFCGFAGLSVAKGKMDSTEWVYIAAFGSITGIIVLAIYILWNVGKSVAVYEKGIILRKWRRIRELPFEEIRSIKVVHDSNPTGTPLRSIYVTFEDGRTMRFGSALERQDELRKGLERGALPHRLERAVSAIARGAVANFGPIAVDSSGLSFKNRQIGWQNVASYYVKQATVRGRAGHLMVYITHTRDPQMHFSCRAHRVPDRDVLKAILTERCVNMTIPNQSEPAK